MKNKLLLSFSILLAGITQPGKVHAQSPYAGIAFGYGMNMASQVLYVNQSNNSSLDNTYTTVKGSLGKGMSTGLFFGYMLNENVGAELGVSYLLGGKTKGTYFKYNSHSDNFDIAAKMIRFTPSVRLAIAGDGKINPYMNFGMVIGVGGKITANSSWSDIGCNCGNMENTLEYTGGISLGATASFGVNYKMSDKLTLFGEAGIVAQNWAPSKSVYTKYTVDGTDQLPTMTTSQKETDFLKNYTASGTTAAPTSEPSKSTQLFFPFSSWGINVGLHFSFGGN